MIFSSWKPRVVRAFPSSVSHQPFCVASAAASLNRRSMRFWISCFTFLEGSAWSCRRFPQQALDEVLDQLLHLLEGVGLELRGERGEHLALQLDPCVLQEDHRLRPLRLVILVDVLKNLLQDLPRL